MGSAVIAYCESCGGKIAAVGSRIMHKGALYHMECSPPVGFEPDPPTRAYVDILKAEIDALREQLARVEAERDRIPQIIRDANPLSGMSWGGFNLWGDEKSIKELRRIENRSSQLEVYSKAYDERVAAEKARAEKAEADLTAARSEIERLREGLVSIQTLVLEAAIKSAEKDKILDLLEHLDAGVDARSLLHKEQGK